MLVKFELLIVYNVNTLNFIWLIKGFVYTSFVVMEHIYKPQNKMFHFCKTFCSKITLVNTIQNVILNPI